jgi:predicted MFS family arabinose efflux permease
MGGVFALAAAVGPVLGGWLADGIGWRWLFWINVPLAGCAVVVAALLLPRERVAAGRIRVDIAGIAALAIGVTAVVLLTSWVGNRYPWRSPVIVVLGVLAVTAVVVFVLAERRAMEPIVDLGLFRYRTFALVTSAALLGAVPIFGVATYLPTYLQMVVGLTATAAGMLMLCMIAGIGSAVVVCAQIVSRTGHYKWLPVGGYGAAACAVLAMTELDAMASLQTIGIVLFLFGCGMGCVVELLVLVAQNSTPAAKVGTVTAVHQFGRELGASLGIALVGSVFVARLGQSLVGSPALNGTAGFAVPDVGPVELGHLSAQAHAAVAAAYEGALTSSFLVVVPFAVISAVVLAFIRPETMRTTLPPAGEDEPSASRELPARSTR